jgi:hypothetical protein
VEENESLVNLVCYGDHIFVGTPKDFRIYEMHTGDLYQKIEVGVKGMFSKRNLLLVALTDFRILLLNMKSKKPLGLLSGHTNWISSIGIYETIGCQIIPLFSFLFFSLSPSFSLPLFPWKVED